MAVTRTPDGRYIVVADRLWRAANPNLDAEVAEQLVKELMAARRAVKVALASGDARALRSARADVNRAKESLGERGTVWWDDGAPDYNRTLIGKTPYADWWKAQDKLCD